MSTGNTCAPADSAIRQTQLSPLVKFKGGEPLPVFLSVVTPSSTIPLFSAHRMTTAFFSKSTCQVRRREFPAADATPLGGPLSPQEDSATLSQRFHASLSAAASGGIIPFRPGFSSCCLVKLFPVTGVSLALHVVLPICAAVSSLYHFPAVRFLPLSAFSAGFPQPLPQPRFIGRIVEMGKSRQKPFFLHHTAPASV